MAKLGDLIVRIGADTRDLNKELGKVRRSMRSMTSNFKSLGQDLTRSLTLPLAAIGAASIKSAADLEKLETSFISLTGGAEQAADMMQQLNEFTAKTPFQIDAVANSARQLIASGSDISEVNEQLQFLGDIAATSGVEINEIAAIFAKVNAKGKVELENLNQLAERGIPIFKALADATGLPADKLGAGRVAVEQFNTVLKSFAQEGGFAAGAMERLSETAAGKFSTALDNLKIAGAALVESLMPALKDAIDFVVRLAQKFTALDDSTKKTILIVGGLAAAVGPLVVGLSSALQSVQLLSRAFTAIGGPISIAIAATAGAVLAFKAIDAAIGKNKTSIEKYQASAKAAEESAISQTAEVRYLVDAYKDETKTLEEREDILNRLKEIDAKHFSNLNAENTSYIDLKKNLEAYTSSLRKSFIEKALAEEGSFLFQTLAADELAIQKKQEILQQARDIEAEAGNITREATKKNRQQIEQELQALERARDNTIASIEEFEARQLALIEKYTQEANAAKAAAESTKVKTDATVESTEATKEATKAQAKNLETLAGLPPALIATAEATKELQKSSTTVADSFTEWINPTIVKFEEFSNSVHTSIKSAVTAMISGAAKMAGSGRGMEGVLNGLLSGLAGMAISLGELAIGYGLAIEGIRKALTSLNPAAAVVAGIALISLGGALQGAINQRMEDAGMPALANGGLAYGPTTAIVGDNRNARIDPEVIAPLSKLQDIMGGNSIQVYGRISGDDILLSNTRAARDRNRYA